MNYFVSDTHFSHKGIMTHCLWRQKWKSVKEMNEGLIEMWNDRISPSDTVYFLGDLAMGDSKKTKSLIKKLNGKKIIVLGNHDRKKEFYLDNGFDQAFDHWLGISLKNPNGSERPVILSHAPYRPSVWKMLEYALFDRKMLRILNKHPKNYGFVLLHGHVHTRWFVKENMINVGIDARNPMYTGSRILSETDILELIRVNIDPYYEFPKY